jgi:hypothetical protein
MFNIDEKKNPKDFKRNTYLSIDKIEVIYSFIEGNADGSINRPSVYANVG